MILRPSHGHSGPGVVSVAMQGINAAVIHRAYHVDATSGNDANDGRSDANPWQTIAKVNGETFNPGESVLFKRGETWRDQLTIPSSGVAGTPIVIGAYGSGAKPIISGAALMSGWAAQAPPNTYRAQLTDWAGGPTAVYFDDVQGTEVANVGALAADRDWVWDGTGWPHWLYIYSAVNPAGRIIEAAIEYICIDQNQQSNLTFQDIRTEKSRFINILIDGNVSNITLYGVEADRAFNDAIRIGAGGATVTPSNVVLDGCGVTLFNRQKTGFSPGIRSRAGASGGDNLTIKNCTITSDVAVPNSGNSEDGIYVEDGDNILIENNTIVDVDHGIVMRGAGAARDVETFTIRYNYIESWDDAVFLYGTTETDSRCYYNLIVNTGDQYFDISGEGGAVYNNVCYGGQNITIYLHTLAATKVIFKNNIITHSDNNTVVIYIDDVAGVNIANSDFDYNLYYRTAPIATFGGFTSGANFTFANWQAAGRDTNGFNQNPLLVAPPGDLRLQAGSPCRNAGVDVGLIRDYVGNRVPMGAAPDIGAYEYVE